MTETIDILKWVDRGTSFQMEMKINEKKVKEAERRITI
jgi:hypothetical protein